MCSRDRTLGIMQSETGGDSHDETRTPSASAPTALDRAKDWILTSRVRVLGTCAALTALLMLVSIVIPSTAISLFLAALLAALTVILTLLALMTWWADRAGRTDSADLWDAGPPDTAHADELLEGFGFTEDGHPRR